MSQHHLQHIKGQGNLGEDLGLEGAKFLNPDRSLCIPPYALRHELPCLANRLICEVSNWFTQNVLSSKLAF